MGQQRRFQKPNFKCMGSKDHKITSLCVGNKIKKNLRIKLKTWARENEIQNKNRKIELQIKMDSMQEEKENKEEDKQEYLKEKEFFSGNL